MFSESTSNHASPIVCPTIKDTNFYFRLGNHNEKFVSPKLTISHDPEIYKMICKMMAKLANFVI